MKVLFSLDVFDGFGPSRVVPGSFDALPQQLPSRKPARLREFVRTEAPRDSGVYGMLDSRGQLIYIGKAKSLRNRLMSYFRKASGGEKTGRIIRHTHCLVWERTPDEFSALLRELELIRRYRPRFNVQGQPGHRRFCYIALGRSPAPYAYMLREPTGKEVALFGPLPSASRATDAARRVNDLFGLRDCSEKQPLHFSDQKDLFPMVRSPGCLRYEIRNCPGPCVGACSRREYGGHVRRAQAFLEGRDLSVLEGLRTSMAKHSQALEFERALAVRDKLVDLTWVTDRLGMLREARQSHSFVYPLAGADGREVWYLIHRAHVHAAMFAPDNDDDKTLARQKMHQIFAGRDERIIQPKGAVDHILLVTAWFRRYAPERERLLQWDPTGMPQTMASPPVSPDLGPTSVEDEPRAEVPPKG